MKVSEKHAVAAVVTALIAIATAIDGLSFATSILALLAALSLWRMMEARN